MPSSKSLLLVAAASLAASPVLAGGLAPVIVEPAPVIVAPPPAAITDWSGFYGGLSYGRLDGKLKHRGFENELDSSGAPGLFAGYNFQSGNLVYGAELGYHFVKDAVQKGVREDGMGNMIDLHGRLGMTAGRALLYSKLGYSSTDYDFVGSGSTNFDGISYGLGADFLVTQNIFVGVDYTRRNLKGDSGLELDASTLGLRVGYKF